MTTTEAKPQSQDVPPPWTPDLDDVELALVCRTGLVALCCRVGGVRSRAFNLSDPDEFVDALAWVNRNASAEATISVLPGTLSCEGAARINGSPTPTGPQGSDVVSYELLPLDLDPPKGLSREELAQWMVDAKRVLASFPLRPSQVVSSGRGLHVYWLLSEPALMADAAPVIEDLARAFGGDMAVRSASQHLRLAGTWNPKEGVRQRAELVASDSQLRYSLEELAHAAQAVSPRPLPVAKASRTVFQIDAGSDWRAAYRSKYDLATELDRIAGPATRGWWRCPCHDERTPSMKLVQGSTDRAICFGGHPEDMGRRSNGSQRMTFDVIELHAWEQNQTVEEFMRDERARLSPASPLNRPAPTAAAPTASVDDPPPLRRAQVTWADQIKMRPVRWAWTDNNEGRIPTGSLSVAAGREGTGKSSFGIWLAAQITRGTLPGSLYGKPRRVLYVAVEDSWEQTLAPRLEAAGADRSMVGRFEVVENTDDDVVTLCLPYDNALLEATIMEHDIALVVMDPLMSLLSDKIETNGSRSVRKALDPLVGIADRTGCLMLGIAHFNKGAGTDPSSLITGSGAFKDVPRSVFGFVRDSDSEEGIRVMTQTKNSLGRDELPSLTYTISDAVVATPEGPAHVGRFTWQGTSDRTAQDILREASGSEDPEERADAAEWIRGYLTDCGGEAPTVDVLKAGRAAGFSEDRLKRAKRKAGAEKSKDGMRGAWGWRLKTTEDEASAEEREERGHSKPAPFAPLLLASAGSDQPTAACSDCGWGFNELGHQQNCEKSA